MIQFTRTDLLDGACETLTFVCAQDSHGDAITSSYVNEDENSLTIVPYLIQITTGPVVGDDFVGLYTLDGDPVCSIGWSWEAAAEVPADVVAVVESTWAGETSVVERVA